MRSVLEFMWPARKPATNSRKASPLKAGIQLDSTDTESTMVFIGHTEKKRIIKKKKKPVANWTPITNYESNQWVQLCQKVPFVA